MSDLAAALLASLDDAALEALAARLRPFLPAPADDGYLDTTAAAEYLSCSPGRIHDLVQLGKLTPLRDGRRLLFKPADLTAYLEGGDVMTVGLVNLHSPRIACCCWPSGVGAHRVHTAHASWVTKPKRGRPSESRPSLRPRGSSEPLREQRI